ncbi:hemerythrin domain-containing protein [Bacillaceae bacterium W0354]
MSGPALKHVDSHAAIHEAALNEARELNDILARLIKEEKLDQALEVAYVTVEHWETRTLRHADAEEEGLYKELVEESPELKEGIIALTRDHDIMRDLVHKIKQQLEKEGVNEELLQKFYALVQVDEYHNEQEEKILPNH